MLPHIPSTDSGAANGDNLSHQAEAFLDFLTTERGLSANTISAYRTDLSQFMAVALQRGARSAQDLDKSHVIAFIAFMTEQHLAPNSIARRTGALHSFAKYLVIDGVRKDDFMSGIDGRKRAKKLPRPLTEQRITALMNHRTRLMRENCVIERYLRCFMQLVCACPSLQISSCAMWTCARGLSGVWERGGKSGSCRSAR